MCVSGPIKCGPAECILSTSSCSFVMERSSEDHLLVFYLHNMNVIFHIMPPIDVF